MKITSKSFPAEVVMSSVNSKGHVGVLLDDSFLIFSLDEVKMFSARDAYTRAIVFGAAHRFGFGGLQ